MHLSQKCKGSTRCIVKNNKIINKRKGSRILSAYSSKEIRKPYF